MSSHQQKSLTGHDCRRDDEEVDAGGSGAVTGQGDVPGVAAEEDDVLLDPVERRYLVHQAVVRNPGTQVGRHVSVQEP